jgi:hypothetical protein
MHITPIHRNGLLLALAASARPRRSGRVGATLLEIYQQALQRDPTIREADARRLAALEAAPQARGVVPAAARIFRASYEDGDVRW